MRIQTNNLDLLKPINALPLLLRSLAALVCFVCAVCGKAGPEAMRRPGRQKCVRHAKEETRTERSSVMLPSSGSNRNPYRRRGL